MSYCCGTMKNQMWAERFKEEEGNYYLVFHISDYDEDYGYYTNNVKVLILYCPFCGKDLRDFK